MANRIDVDVLIFGAGIAGLWTLDRVVAAGYSALLLEADAIGAGQTRCAQGIIHGGVKYRAGRSKGVAGLEAMPRRWLDHVEGLLEPKLTGVKILSDAHYLWARGFFASRVVAKIARRAMSGEVVPVKGEQRPELFRMDGFKGSVYRVAEPVIDVHSLLESLATPHLDRMLRVSWPYGVSITPGRRPRADIRLPGGEHLTLFAQRLLYTGGSGNLDLLKFSRRNTHGVTRSALRIPMQRRPLHMIMLRGDLPPATYAHAIGGGTTPRITITSHVDAEGRDIWYLGGALAEEGVNLTPEAHIKDTWTKIEALLPWVDLSGVEWASFHVDRAEPRTTSNKRPDDLYAEDTGGGVIVAWPTKMALAPLLAERVIELLKTAGIEPQGHTANVRDLGLDPAAVGPAITANVWDLPRQWR